MKSAGTQASGVSALAAAGPVRSIAAAAACAALVANCAVIFSGATAWAQGLGLLAAKGLFSCGIGLCVWRLARSLPASLALAVSAQFMGILMCPADHPGFIGLCLSPWVLYCWLEIADAGSLRASVPWSAGLLAVSVAEMSAGTAREAWALLFWMNFSGACVLLMSARPVREKCRLLCGLAAAAVVFAVVASQAWPTSFRALGDLGAVHGAQRALQIQPGLFLALFDGTFYGPFQVYAGGVGPSANFFILTGLLWCVVRWRPLLLDRRAAALAASSLAAVALVFGVLPSALTGRVPFLGRIAGLDEAFSPAVVVLFAVLAGYGWGQAWRRLGSPDGRREAIAVILLLCVAYASYLGTAQAIVRSAYASLTWGEFVRLGAHLRAYGLSLVAASAALMWAMHRALRRGSLGPAAAICAVLALLALHWRMAPRPRGAAPAHRVAHADPRPLP
jgi:hypothetical protein